MLNEDQLEMFSGQLTGVFQQLEQTIINDIARRVRKSERWTETAELQAGYLRDMGWSPTQIRMEVIRALNASPDYVRWIDENTLEAKRVQQEAIDEAKEALRRDAPELFEAVGNMAFNNDLSLWEEAGQSLRRGTAVDALVTAMQKRATDDLLNLTGSLAFRQPVGTTIPARRAFVAAMNDAITQVVSGTVSYQQACTNAVRSLARSGLRWVDYESGVTRQLDTAARNAVLTASGQLAGDIMQTNIEQSGVAMVQVSRHWGARDSHAVWQGGIYTLEQFRVICGYGEPSNPDHIYSYNCRHVHYPYWPGISEPVEYAPEPGPFEVNGKRYTYYQATQKQRAMERDIRALKREALAQEALGDKTALAAAKLRIDEKTAQYNAFSRATNLREKVERTAVLGYDKAVAAKARVALDEWLHETYGGYLGTFTVTESAAKYREISRAGNMRLLNGFVKAVDKGDVHVLVGIEVYIDTARAIEQRLVGVTAVDGTTITGYVTHFVDRVIGQVSEPHKGRRMGVPVDRVLDTLLTGSLGMYQANPTGKTSQQIVGADNAVTVNPISGELIQVNPRGG